MDVPTRTSYVMAVVTPAERAAAASVTAVPRSLAAAASPMLAGSLLARLRVRLAAGHRRRAEDRLRPALLAMFRKVRPPEERVDSSRPVSGRADNDTEPLARRTACARFGDPFRREQPFAKLLRGAVDPWLLAGLLYLGSGLGLGDRALRGALGLPAEAPLRRGDLPWLGGGHARQAASPARCCSWSASSAPLASASLLLNVEGLATMGIAWVVFRENVDWRIVLGAMLSWPAPSCYPGKGPPGVELGRLAIVGACVAWGIDNNLTRKLSAADPVQIAMLKGLVAGSVNLRLAVPGMARRCHRPCRCSAPVVGFLGYGVSPGAVHPGRCATSGRREPEPTSRAAPFIGAVLALALFGEPITARLVGPPC